MPASSGLVNRSLEKTRGLTLLKKYPFKQGVLVSEHQTFVGRRAMTLLESRQRLLILLDRRLKLLDVLGPALSEGSLRLSVALLTLFRRSVDLVTHQYLLYAQNIQCTQRISASK